MHMCWRNNSSWFMYLCICLYICNTVSIGQWPALEQHAVTQLQREQGDPGIQKRMRQGDHTWIKWVKDAVSHLVSKEFTWVLCLRSNCIAKEISSTGNQVCKWYALCRSPGVRGYWVSSTGWLCSSVKHIVRHVSDELLFVVYQKLAGTQSALWIKNFPILDFKCPLWQRFFNQ